jgi:hypothetical protein
MFSSTWEAVCGAKAPGPVSWFRSHPETSLALTMPDISPAALHAVKERLRV